jgi:hypothetical protein
LMEKPAANLYLNRAQPVYECDICECVYDTRCNICWKLVPKKHEIYFWKLSLLKKVKNRKKTNIKSKMKKNPYLVG